MIPALVGLAVTVTLGLVLSVIGFILCGKREVSAAGLPVWLLTILLTGLVLMPVLCSVVDEPAGHGPPTAEGYQEMAEFMALWALLPGVSFCVGGVVLIVTALRRGKRAEDPQVVNEEPP